MSKQMKLLGECSGSIDSVKRLEHKLAEEEEHFPGFVNLNSTETQTAGEWVVLNSRQSEIEDLEAPTSLPPSSTVPLTSFYTVLS